MENLHLITFQSSDREKMQMGRHVNFEAYRELGISARCCDIRACRLSDGVPFPHSRETSVPLTCLLLLASDKALRDQLIQLSGNIDEACFSMMSSLHKLCC